MRRFQSPLVYILVFHYSISAFTWETNNLGLKAGLTQTGLCSHSSRLEARDLGFERKKNCTFCVAKTKTLISCAITAQLFVIFSPTHVVVAAHLSRERENQSSGFLTKSDTNQPV